MVNWTSDDLRDHLSRRKRRKIAPGSLESHLSVPTGITPPPPPTTPPNEDHRVLPAPVTQHLVQDESLGEEGRKAKDAGRFLVRVTSFRSRSTDIDNICPKYAIDCLRYAQIIPEDSPDCIELVVRQEKVKTKAEERTEIEVTQL
jgi:hypothetical protein